MRGIAGPGYQYPPWQTLLFGHGDAWQRARVFLLLCRQQGIQAVLLAFPGRTTPPRPRAWLPAVLIADQLYLFDVRLGGLNVACLPERNSERGQNQYASDTAQQRKQ